MAGPLELGGPGELDFEGIKWITEGERENILKVILCKKFLFLHQLTHNMITICSLNYKFNT